MYIFYFIIMKVEEKINYDDIPVVYCKRCHSLKIIAGDNFPDYCQNCGSTDLGNETIQEWLEQEPYYRGDKKTL